MHRFRPSLHPFRHLCILSGHLSILSGISASFQASLHPFRSSQHPFRHLCILSGISASFQSIPTSFQAIATSHLCDVECLSTVIRWKGRVPKAKPPDKAWEFPRPASWPSHPCRFVEWWLSAMTTEEKVMPSPCTAPAPTATLLPCPPSSTLMTESFGALKHFHFQDSPNTMEK